MEGEVTKSKKIFFFDMLMISELKENTAVRRSEFRKPLQQSLPLATAVRKIYFLRSVPKLPFSQDSSSENTCLEALQRN